ncbi:MAG: RNA polymerase sigma factor [Gammaproteobacteria bacterium]|nr:RNA polymerase sigma factor [Gammaproteobacteria bacterium]
MKNPILGYCQIRDFRQRLSNNRSRLYRLAYSWCHQHELADDLTQETMAKALKNIKQLRDPEALDSWLYGILNNCWRDYLRAKKNLENIDDVVMINEETPESTFERQDLCNIIQSQMQQLNLGQRQVLSLVDLQGCSYEDVAKVLDIPVGTVMSRLSRARKNLADALLEYRPVNTGQHNKILRRIV